MQSNWQKEKLLPLILKYKIDIGIITFLGIVSFLILNWRLDYTSLHPWDEAWYASIAQNLVNDNQFLDLSYNNKPFWDHPPLGFYFMFISVKILGNNDYAMRLPSVILASLCIILVYLFNRKTIGINAGLQSALILFSTRWFLLRSRTGNLDIILIFFQMLTFYCLYFAKTKKQLYVTWFIFGLTMLTKSSISLVFLPILLIKSIELFKKLNWSKKDIVYILISFFVPLIPWYGYNSFVYGFTFLRRNLLAVGLRNGGMYLSSYATKLYILYLRSMVHKWFYGLVFSIILSIVFIKKNSIFYILSYFLLLAIPLYVSGQAAIWHMIPLAIPMALLIPQIINESTLFIKSKIKHRIVLKYNFANAVVTFIIFFIAGYSWKYFIPELYAANKFSSTPALLAQNTKSYPGYIIIDEFNDYSTTINYYAGKHTELMRDLSEKTIMPETNRPFILITNQNFVDKIDLYESCKLVYSYETYRIVTCD